MGRRADMLTAWLTDRYYAPDDLVWDVCGRMMPPHKCQKCPPIERTQAGTGTRMCRSMAEGIIDRVIEGVAFDAKA